MEHYVTLFDSLFLPQGLALYISMKRHISSFTLWVLCVDDEVHDVLTRLQLSNVHLLQLSRIETEDLIRVRQIRSKGEYCWTLTPFAPRFVYAADSTVQRVTFIDADLWFRKDPGPIFEELAESKKFVLITDHSFSPELDYSATNGQYCVQFMTFYRKEGEIVRQWWEDRCIEWCYDRLEAGKFGDQMYLNDWPSRFKSIVHVLANKELALAPWNALRFPYGNSIFWHFQSLRLGISKGNIYVDFGSYTLPRTTIKNIYLPYIQDLRLAFQMANNINYEFKSQKNINVFLRCKQQIKLLARELWRFMPSHGIKITLF